MLIFTQYQSLFQGLNILLYVICDAFFFAIFVIQLQQQKVRKMSQCRIYKFLFTADIKTVTLALKFPCVVSTIWKRGQKAAEVKERKQIQDGVITFNEKLTIQCNMQYDEKKKMFEEKKTKFTILIFSQKGNKQAGQVYLDVAEILNKKQQCIKYQKTLEKCPDKNAKLTFQLTATYNTEIKQDQISMASTKTYDMQAAINETKPDFKKKKKETAIDGNNMNLQKKNTPQGDTDMHIIKQKAAQLIRAKSRSQKQIGQTNLSIPKQNVAKINYLKLQQQNKRLMQQLNQLKQLKLQNQNLKRQFEEQEKKNVSYYKKKFEELRKEYQQYKEMNSKNEQMAQKRNMLEKQMCQCKERMGRILNFAILSGKSQYNALIEDFEQIKKSSTISNQNAGRQSKKVRGKR